MNTTLTRGNGDTNLLHITVDEYLDEVSNKTNSTGHEVIPDDMEDLMDWVFGEDEENTISSGEEDTTSDKC